MTPKYTLLLLPFATLYCSASPEQPRESLSTTQEALYGGGTVDNFWANGTVPVCFQPGNSSNNPWPPTAQMMQLTQEILRDTWGRVTNLKFTGWNVCSDSVPTNHPNTLAIGFWTDGNSTERGGARPDRWTSSGIPVLDSSHDAALFRYRAIHETGHALGFEHDQDRPDNWTGGPGNWHSVYCPSDGSGTAGPIAGGNYYGPHDNDSVMSYCNPTGALGSKDGRLSALDVTGIRTVYSFVDSTIVHDDIPNYHADPTLLSCQYLTDTYGGISSGIIHGYDPSNVHQLWTDWGCNVAPQFDTNTLCQTVSDLYGVVANGSWGYAPNLVQIWWQGRHCNTKPLVTEDICQRASDTYGIIPNTTWGTAPSEVQSWWSDPNRGNCQTAAPKNPDSCQHFSDLYGTVWGVDFGWAPTAAQTWWSGHGCKSSPTTGQTTANRCQQLSDLFATSPGDFAFASTEAQNWWVAHGCTTVPLSTNSCQKAADLYYINPNHTFGTAPGNVQTWWSGRGCNTLTRLNGRACLDAAARYGIIPNVSFGFAPQEVQNWWSGVGNCNVAPSGPEPLPG